MGKTVTILTCWNRQPFYHDATAATILSRAAGILEACESCICVVVAVGVQAFAWTTVVSAAGSLPASAYSKGPITLDGLAQSALMTIHDERVGRRDAFPHRNGRVDGG